MGVTALPRISEARNEAHAEISPYNGTHPGVQKSKEKVETRVVSHGKKKVRVYHVVLYAIWVEIG